MQLYFLEVQLQFNMRASVQIAKCLSSNDYKHHDEARGNCIRGAKLEPSDHYARVTAESHRDSDHDV